MSILYIKNAKVFVTIILCSFTTFINSQGRYTKGDFHQHTTFTDGYWSMPWVMSKENALGLDWWVSSEHGGAYAKNGRWSGLDTGKDIYWESSVPPILKGNRDSLNGHRRMWRWQSIMDTSFFQVKESRKLYPGKTILQGLEWNVPGHEHASVCIINNQFNSNPDCTPVAQFEFKFDDRDRDTLGGVSMGWTKGIEPYGKHSKAIEAIRWLQKNYPTTSWVVPGHPERRNKYRIGTFREMNDIAPGICFGFESMPGHHGAAVRGEYPKERATGGSTYGGCGIYAAKVGGLWDALLSEGRVFSLFANSDFHDVGDDFLPGEYLKNYVYTKSHNAQGIVDGLRSGNTYVVEGDLIDSLRFSISYKKKSASMGETLMVPVGAEITFSIKFRDPQGNNNNKWSDYKNPEVDHIDVITGLLRDRLSFSADTTSDYQKKDTVATTKVTHRFGKKSASADINGLQTVSWKDLGEGWREITFRTKVIKDSYFRLRGTNHGIGVINETDGAGNPLPDTLMEPNNPSKAFADLWFYSNSIFLKIKK
jgi:hypothetical protein